MQLSGIADKYGISRQSVRNWVQRHEDFPTPIISDGAKLLVAGKKGADKIFTVVDPHGRTQFYDMTEVDAWVKDHGGTLRSQNGGTTAKAKPKAKAKTATKAPAKTVKPKAGTKAKTATTAKSKTKAAPKATPPAKKGKKKGKRTKA
jgi:hypothetical protein